MKKGEQTTKEKEVKRAIRKIVTESNAAYRKACGKGDTLLEERLFGEAILRILALGVRESALATLNNRPFYNKKTAKEYTFLRAYAFREIWPFLMRLNEFYYKVQERTKEKYAALLTRMAISEIALFDDTLLPVLEWQPFFAEWVAREYAKKGELVTQREVAAHFSVSEADISKMVARLKRQKIPSGLWLTAR